MRNLKNCINELICKTERLTDIENKLMITIGEGEAVHLSKGFHGGRMGTGKV